MLLNSCVCRSGHYGRVRLENEQSGGNAMKVKAQTLDCFYASFNLHCFWPSIGWAHEREVMQPLLCGILADSILANT